ncbi:MAG TPA: hypothetical protein VNO51_18605, partial [Ilumatobacteraceae bacterium]|nr:hypothetical protein [Ilumatobacteraceae bacterium]
RWRGIVVLAVVLTIVFFGGAAGSEAARGLHQWGGMTIQNPPNDDTPPAIPVDEPDETPIDTPAEPEQRAPGADQPPIGAPSDEPDPDLG